MRYTFARGADGRLVEIPDKDAAIPPKCSIEAVEFKRVMVASLDRYLEDHEDESKKSVALTLGASQADMSHWLSLQCDFTIPAHKVAHFCRIVGSNALLWHMQSKYEEAV